MNGTIQVWRGDITTLNVDAIVNAANSSLLGGGGVDGAIHRAAGPELLEACKKLDGAKTGEAKWTKGFNLPSKYVIHTVGLVYKKGSSEVQRQLAACYENALEIAKNQGIQSIAFPAISTGIYGYPAEEAAEIAVKTIKRKLEQFPIRIEVTLVAFDEKTEQLYKKNLEG
ncbi:O-acetyl-ADP-ribose deacetylase [Marinilactibacillus sp. GCM10026970]|uniref:O-acetyl-ADP-ribose deacetylase n=1 Tax=Marinilactibacillus sp. GCM10026970 TaxID=3252642 RepID=UPI003605DF19